MGMDGMANMLSVEIGMNAAGADIVKDIGVMIKTHVLRWKEVRVLGFFCWLDG